MKNIYFAASIRGGRDDAALYRKLIAKMQEKHKVLTEHIGSVSLKSEAGKGDTAIYEQDISWLKNSDMVIAECTTPSLGVGYELAYAESINVPVYIFYNKNKCNLSAMLNGNSYFHVYSYESEEELFEKLNKIFLSIKE